MFYPNARLLLNAANLAVGASQPWPLHIDKPKKEKKTKKENKKQGVNLHLLTCLRVIIKMYIKKFNNNNSIKTFIHIPDYNCNKFSLFVVEGK